MLNNLLYATNFAAEQTAGGQPARLQPINNGATVQGQSIDALGYAFQVTVSGTNSWTLPLPIVVTSQRWVKRSMILRINSGGPGVEVNVFGLPIISLRVNRAQLSVGQAYHICTVLDTDKGVTSAFVQGRYIGAVTGTSELQVTGSGTVALRITDIVVCESDDDPAPVNSEFTALALTEVSSDGWTFDGTDLVDSLDKDQVTVLSPRASTYATGSKFVVNGNGDSSQIVDLAGSVEEADKYSLLVTVGGSSYIVEPGTTQTAIRTLVGGSGPIEVERVLKPLTISLDVQNDGDQVRVFGNTGVRVSWGDGGTSVLASGTTHTYEKAGQYDLQVFGPVQELEVGGAPVVALRDWGALPELQRLAFYVADADLGSANLVDVPDSIPETITSMENMFCKGGSVGPGITRWLTFNVTNMSGAFRDNVLFDQPLSYFNTQAVSVMDNMFNGATLISGDLTNWCTSLIQEEPTGFRTGALRLGSSPAWGTCSDPLFQNVTLLVDMNTSLEDTSKDQRPVVTQGAVQLDGATTLFGKPTARFIGGPNYLSVAAGSSPDLGLEAFTLEWWIYPTALGNYLLDTRAVSDSPLGVLTELNGSLYYYLGAANNVRTPPGSLKLNTWQHIAISKISAGLSSQHLVFIDGQEQARRSFNVSLAGSKLWRIGHYWASSGASFIGCMGGFRVTLGIARYTGNFIPPSGRFRIS